MDRRVFSETWASPTLPFLSYTALRSTHDSAHRRSVCPARASSPTRTCPSPSWVTVEWVTPV